MNDHFYKILTMLVVVMFVFVFQEYRLEKTENHELIEELKRYDLTYRFHPVPADATDSTAHQLFSPNSGRDWYYVDTNGCILGPAEDPYQPTEEMLAWDALTDAVLLNGPIDPTDSAGRQLLEKVGFEIRTADE